MTEEIIAAGLVIDNWKVKIFRKHLDKAGFSYKEAGHLTEEQLVIHVDVDDPDKLVPIVVAAEEECRRSKMN